MMSEKGKLFCIMWENNEKKKFSLFQNLHLDNNDFHHAKWKYAVLSQSQLHSLFALYTNSSK